MAHQNLAFEELLNDTKIIPVLVIKKLETAIPVAKKLIDQGYNTLEITLRTEGALDAMKAIKKSFPDAIVGAGTITDGKQLQSAYEAGAQFAVSPGTTDELLQAANEFPLPFLPGVSTTSEAMNLRSNGYKFMKLFPAEAIGGIALLKSIYGPLPDLKFCPTGGINVATADEYLELPNVICVGGSWMV